MTKIRKNQRRSIWLAALAALLLMVTVPLQATGESLASIQNDRHSDSALSNIKTSQTSASYLRQYMIARYEGNWQKTADRDAERQRLALVSDIYIKAWSYAFWNKTFFFVSLILAFIVLIWPSISVIAPQNLGEKPIFKSAVVQTTITALAAASFFAYSDYKEKQLSAENLMRYVIHSDDHIQIISAKVIEELTRVDKGFSFSKVITNTEQARSASQ